MRIRVASAIEPLHAILTDCGVDMQDRLGLTHWVPAYPLGLLREKARAGTVFEVATDAGDVIGTFTLDSHAPAHATEVPWSPAGEPAMYLTRLAVRPNLQRQGVGSWCMGWIEQHARASGARSVRLDAHREHEALLRFYRRLGYSERGAVEAFATPLTCFEKVLQ